MAGLELTSALARLLSDRELRLRFTTDAAAVVRELKLEPCDAAVLCRVDPVALEAQAQTLLGKRRVEVARIAPCTWTLLGAAGERLFAEYASDHWPAGHLRHPQDALAFLRFLAARGLSHDPIEVLRLETRLSKRRHRLSLVRGGRWHLPALYYGCFTRGGWSERLLHVGPWRRPNPGWTVPP